MSSTADQVQIRMVAEQVAETAILKFVQEHPNFGPPPLKAEIPAPLRWAGIIISSLFTVGVSAACIWGVSTLNELQITVARMDERQQQDTAGQEIIELKARVAKLEEKVK